MNSYSNFREFYEKELRADLEEIDRERRKVRRQVLTILAFAIPALVMEIVLIPGDTSFPKTLVIILTSLAAIILLGIYGRSFRSEYKTRIISRVAAFADEGLTYSPDSVIPKEEFVRSRIFLHSCDQYSGEDHFKGKIGKTEIEFSEVTARYLSNTGPGSKQKEDYYVYFRGLFIIADFNKNFKTQTVVLPDRAEKLLGKFGQSLQSVSGGRGELIRLEDPRFEKEFCVYGEDQVEARYILTPSLMERILAFKNKWNKDVYLSFLDSRVCIAISMYKNLFELRPFKPAADYAFLEESLRFLTLLIEVVDDLNLNTRIWTRE